MGGLPDRMKLQVVEPLRLLFKDEVRRVGRELGLDPNILGRHPFPGPGLAIRILGEITPEKVALLQEVDHIFIQGLRDDGLYDQVWQAGATLPPAPPERTGPRLALLHHTRRRRTDQGRTRWVPAP